MNIISYPKKIAWQPYVHLMRLHRPIGIWLLLWPTLIALWLAGEGEPKKSLVVVFTGGVILMRSAGCVINDWADRHFDGFVQRTRDRPLVLGTISEAKTLKLFFGLLLFAFGLVCTTSLFTMGLSIGGLLLAILYPFMKRFMPVPQLILGAAFAWAIPMAYAAQKGTLSLDCWMLFLATVLWTMAYDTLYAMADKEDDLKVGIRSAAIFFGQHDKLMVAIFHFASMALFCLIGFYLHLQKSYFVGIMGAVGLICYQLWLVKNQAPAKCLQAFLNNQWVGALLFIGTFLAYVFA